MNKEIQTKEYIIQFYALTSLDDNTITTVIAKNLEEAEKKAREKTNDGKIREIRDIWEIRDSQKIRII